MWRQERTADLTWISKPLKATHCCVTPSSLTYLLIQQCYNTMVFKPRARSPGGRGVKHLQERREM